MRIRLALVRDLEVLSPNPRAARTARLYVRQKLMLANGEGDALHLALASHCACDVLVTWNFHHLANPNKLNRITKVNEALGIFVPRIL